MKDISKMNDVTVLSELKRLSQRNTPIKGTYVKTLKEDIFESPSNITTVLHQVKVGNSSILVPITDVKEKTEESVNSQLINKLIKSVKNPRQKQILQTYIEQEKQRQGQSNLQSNLIQMEQLRQSVIKSEPTRKEKPNNKQLAIDNVPYKDNEPMETVEELKLRMASDKKKLQLLTTGIVPKKEAPAPKKEAPVVKAPVVKDEPILENITHDSDEEEDIVKVKKTNTKKSKAVTIAEGVQLEEEEQVPKHELEIKGETLLETLKKRLETAKGIKSKDALENILVKYDWSILDKALDDSLFKGGDKLHKELTEMIDTITKQLKKK